MKLNIGYYFQSSNNLVILLYPVFSFFIQGSDEIHIVDSIRNIGVSVIAQGCGQTLGLGLGQSKDIVVVFY